MQAQRWYLDAQLDALILAPELPDQAGEHTVDVEYSVVTGEPLTPFWPSSQHGHGFSFETAPFKTPTPDRTLRRLAVAVLDEPDGDTFAYLEEINPAGRVHLRAHGRLQVEHRKLARRPMTTWAALASELPRGL